MNKSWMVTPNEDHKEALTSMTEMPGPKMVIMPISEDTDRPRLVVSSWKAEKRKRASLPQGPCGKPKALIG